MDLLQKCISVCLKAKSINSWKTLSVEISFLSQREEIAVRPVSFLLKRGKRETSPANLFSDHMAYHMGICNCHLTLTRI